MSIKFSTSKETIDWIRETKEIPDMHDWADFVKYYSVNVTKYISKCFTYSKKDYIRIATPLTHMMIESFLVCPTDEIFHNYFYHHFSCLFLLSV